MVSETHGFCGECWRSFSFISKPMCACCGLPFEYEVQTIHEITLCGSCIEEQPHFKTARSALIYNDASKNIILPFKHQDRTDFAKAMGRLMHTAGHDMIEDADAILPVPLHFTRLFLRRFNQSALLVHVLSKLSDKPMLLNVLKRHRRTQSQGHLSKEMRKKNVHNAFVVHPKNKPQIEGKKLLLVDDVFTTGATANACVAALKRAGAARVDVLTFARVVKTNN